LRTASSTLGVMFISPDRPGTLKVRYSVCDFKASALLRETDPT